MRDNFLYELISFDVFRVKIGTFPDVYCVFFDIFFWLLPHTEKEHYVFLFEVVLVEDSI